MHQRPILVSCTIWKRRYAKNSQYIQTAYCISIASERHFGDTILWKVIVSTEIFLLHYFRRSICPCARLI